MKMMLAERHAGCSHSELEINDHRFILSLRLYVGLVAKNKTGD